MGQIITLRAMIYDDDTFAVNFAPYNVPLFPMSCKEQEMEINNRYSGYEQKVLRVIHIKYRKEGVEAAHKLRRKKYKKVVY